MSVCLYGSPLGSAVSAYSHGSHQGVLCVPMAPTRGRCVSASLWLPLSLCCSYGSHQGALYQCVSMAPRCSVGTPPARGRCVPFAASPRRRVAAESAEPPRVVAAGAVKHGHVIIAAVSVRLHVELPETQLHHLGGGRGGDPIGPSVTP